MPDSRPLRFSISAFAIFLLSSPLLAFEVQLEEISRSVAMALAERGKTRVAVVDFTDIQGDPSPLGSFLAEELSVALVSAAAGFEVVDRLHLQTILGENELRRAGVFERQTTQRLLELTGVDALVTGRITPSSRRIRVTVKVLDTETASLLGAASASLERDELIDELLTGSAGAVRPAEPAAQPSRPASTSTSASTSAPAEPDIRTEAPPAPPPVPRDSAPRVTAASAPPAPPMDVKSPTSPPSPIAAIEAPPVTAAPPTPAAPGATNPAPVTSKPLPAPPTAPESRVEVPADRAPAVTPARTAPMEPELPDEAAPPASPPTAPPATRAPILEPVTISVQAVRTLESSVRVTLVVQNNTSSVLEWGESGDSALADIQGSLLVCSECPEGVDADAVLIAARDQAEVDLFFAHDLKAAALEKRDAFAFFFNAKSKGTTTFDGPFTLTLNYEYRASGRKEPNRSRVVFADLVGEPADR